MEFTETEDRSTLRKFARDVAERELAPRATHWDETEEFPQASWDALKAAGLFGVTVSEDYGEWGWATWKQPSSSKSSGALTWPVPSSPSSSSTGRRLPPNPPVTRHPRRRRRRSP